MRFLKLLGHGIYQGRLDGLKINVAAFTQFSQDHLDYHSTMEEYFESKKMLFSKYLDKLGVAVLNVDIPEFNDLKKIAEKRGIKIVSYGESDLAEDIRLIKIFKDENQNLCIELKIVGKIFTSKVPFLCKFQCKNLLTAIGVMIALGFNPDLFINEIPYLVQPSGRMENVTKKDGSMSNVYIDYAHTPDALNVVLNDIKSIHTEGKLIVLFGCGGDRDARKRPLMGEIVSKVADVVIITDDNPRNERPDLIRKDIINGISLENINKVIEIGDRREAIKKALSIKSKEDIVILAGRGDEKFQIISEEEVPFFDKKIASEFIS